MTNPEIRDLGLTDSNTNSNAGCSCCAPGQASTSSEGTVGSETDGFVADFFVEGMTCSHCASSVTEELADIEGVSGVSVDLDAGGTSRVTISSSSQMDVEQVRRAVEEAGYALAQTS